MKRVFPSAVLIVLACGLCVAQGGPWLPDQTAVAIPMRDGASLAADVYLPKEPGKYATILIQTPYNRKVFRPALHLPGAQGIFNRAHYAYVILDWRGFFESRPAAQGVRRPDHGQDGYNAVEWIAQQPWSNGKVGTWGASALGKVQFMTAKEQPPHLVCCVPVVAAEGNAYEDFCENGVFRTAHLKSLVNLGYSGFGLLDRITDCTQLLRLFRGRSDQVEAVNVPVFMITGWYDHGTQRELGTFRALLERAGPVTREHTNMLIGPWEHIGIGKAQQGALRYDEAAGESERQALRFFDYWLRDQKGNGWEKAPLFAWWQMNESGWKSSDDPDGPATEEPTLTLHADGRLDEAPPAADEPSRTFTADPASPVPTIGGANLGRMAGEGVLTGPQDQAPLEQRGDVLVYTAQPTDEPLRVFGSVTLTFSFSIDRPDASFAVRLCDVHPDGRSMLLCDGITRAKYREGPDHAAKVTPGEAYAATLVLPPTAVTIADGHRLRLSVSGSNTPRFELNPNTGADRYDAAEAAPVKCVFYHDTARPTRLTVPLLKWGPPVTAVTW